MVGGTSTGNSCNNITKINHTIADQTKQVILIGEHVEKCDRPSTNNTGNSTISTSQEQGMRAQVDPVLLLEGPLLLEALGLSPNTSAGRGNRGVCASLRTPIVPVSVASDVG